MLRRKYKRGLLFLQGRPKRREITLLWAKVRQRERRGEEGGRGEGEGIYCKQQEKVNDLHFVPGQLRLPSSSSSFSSRVRLAFRDNRKRQGPLRETGGNTRKILDKTSRKVRGEVGGVMTSE